MTSFWAAPRSLVATCGISVDFFSSGYLDISVLRVRFRNLCIQLRIPHKRWVSPFGHCRIKACCQLPDTFRRLPRPSSPLTAKASTVCALSLDHITRKRFGSHRPATLAYLPQRHILMIHQDACHSFTLSKNTARPQRHAVKFHRVRYMLQFDGGASRDRTGDPLLAKQVLSQLSYGPMVVGLGGLEPPASPLSGVRSNHLSYRPMELTQKRVPVQTKA